MVDITANSFISGLTLEIPLGRLNQHLSYVMSFFILHFNQQPSGRRIRVYKKFSAWSAFFWKYKFFFIFEKCKKFFKVIFFALTPEFRKCAWGFFRESIRNFSKGAKSCGFRINQASFQNIRNFRLYFFSGNIRNFLRVNFFYFGVGVGKSSRKLQHSLLLCK